MYIISLTDQQNQLSYSVECYSCVGFELSVSSVSASNVCVIDCSLCKCMAVTLIASVVWVNRSEHHERQYITAVTVTRPPLTAHCCWCHEVCCSALWQDCKGAQYFLNDVLLHLVINSELASSFTCTVTRRNAANLYRLPCSRYLRLAMHLTAVPWVQSADCLCLTSVLQQLRSYRALNL